MSNSDNKILLLVSNVNINRNDLSYRRMPECCAIGLVNALTVRVESAKVPLSWFPIYRELALPERLPYTRTGSFAILTLPLL